MLRNKGEGRIPIKTWIIITQKGTTQAIPYNYSNRLRMKSLHVLCSFLASYPLQVSVVESVHYLDSKYITLIELDEMGKIIRKEYKSECNSKYKSNQVRNRNR